MGDTGIGNTIVRWKSEEITEGSWMGEMEENGMEVGVAIGNTKVTVHK
jgi:predicted HAD superfamily phosphohydrolase YqeG